MRIDRVYEYPGYLLRFRHGKTPSPRALVNFHGFPGHKAIKNLDLVDALHRELGIDCYLLHYQGLGESGGDFRFTASVAEGAALVRRLVTAEGHRSVDIMGNSWGGLVGINAAVQVPEAVRSLALLCPFSDIRDQGALYRWFVDTVRSEEPRLFRNLSDEEIKADFERIREQHLPAQLVSRLSPKLPVLIVQGAHDDVTPTSIIRPLLAKFPTAPQYVEVDDDHGLMRDREAIAATLARFLA